MSVPDLKQYGITVERVLRNPAPAKLYAQALTLEKGSVLADNGALVALSGEKTGRSPKDKRVVKHPESEDNVWWGPINFPLPEESFLTNRQRAIDFLNTRDQLYVIDAFAGWDPKYQIKVRIICARAYHALFMHNMLIRPTAEQLADFGEPDYVVFNGGQQLADPDVPGVGSKTCVTLCLEHKEFVILGTEYAGEMKKGIFTVMNYIMPKTNVLSMHCSANEADDKTTSIFFGLSGTGKTTLSADPRRQLIGDDEHCWSDNGLFNIEGGCYAKVINLSREAEPEIYDSLKFGAVLENVVLDDATHGVHWEDTSITQNTRGSYPIEHIVNARIPCVGDHPNNVVFLTCDAFGILPPVSVLTPNQAMYHFISGYTAKVAGTEVGVTEPEATFSACFGAPFLVWHPAKYAELLAERIEKHHAKTWLINTGWSGGPYGVGARIKLKYTRAIVDAIHSGELAAASTVTDPTFGVEIPTSCPGVPSEVLTPRATWADKEAYDRTAKKLAGLFIENFKTFEAGSSDDILGAAPKV